MMIPGLPAMPSKDSLEGGPPAKRGTSVRHHGGLKLIFNRGRLHRVENPKGKLPPVYICQTAYPGFTVRLDQKPFTMLGYGYRKAENLAVRLALRGHKKVNIRG